MEKGKRKSRNKPICSEVSVNSPGIRGVSPGTEKKQTVRRGDLHRWDKIWREGVCRLFPATVTPHLCSGESWAEKKTEQIEQRME